MLIITAQNALNEPEDYKKLLSLLAGSVMAAIYYDAVVILGKSAYCESTSNPDKNSYCRTTGNGGADGANNFGGVSLSGSGQIVCTESVTVIGTPADGTYCNAYRYLP